MSNRNRIIATLANRIPAPRFSEAKQEVERRAKWKRVDLDLLALQYDHEQEVEENARKNRITPRAS